MFFLLQVSLLEVVIKHTEKSLLVNIGHSAMNIITHDHERHESAILWALTVPIKGRRDAVQIARKILVALATRAGSRPDIPWYFLVAFCTVSDLAAQLDVSEQSIRRALERLEDQSLINKVNDRVIERAFRINFGEDTKIENYT